MLNLITRYPGQIISGDPDYPLGKARNRVSPGDGTGTPFEEDLLNDILGSQQALLAAASITPSGDPDKVGASDILNAILALRVFIPYRIGTDAVLSEKTFSTASQGTLNTGIHWSNDGKKLFLLDRSGTPSIYQYSATKPNDPSTLTYDGISLSVAAQDADPEGFCFNAAGTRIYVAGPVADRIYQYNLPTAFSLVSGAYSTKSLLVSGQTSNPKDVAISSDGLALYVLSLTGQVIYQYTLSGAGELDTASYASKSFAVSGVGLNTTGIYLAPDNKRFFVRGDVGVLGFRMATAKDINTSVSLLTILDISSVVGNTCVTFSFDGTKLYTIGGLEILTMWHTNRCVAP